MRSAPAPPRRRYPRRGADIMTATALIEPLEGDGAVAAADAHHLDWLESEAIHILREVAGQCRNPALLFSGGKDSLVLLRLAEKAFRPGPFPFPLLHIDTGHNFKETLDFRDELVAQLGERLVIALVESAIQNGRAVEDSGPIPSRNRAQIPTLLDAIHEH